MKSEFLLAFNEICSDRGLPRAVVLDAVEKALVSAYRRNTDVNTVENVTAEIDPSSGEARIFVQKEVVEEVADPAWELSLPKARAIDPDAELGELITVEDTPDNFGRIAAQTAKQVILQRIREAERDVQYEHYVEQEGEIVHGTVQSVRSNVVLVNLGGAEAILPRSQQVPGERYHIHQRLRAYVLEVRNTNRGPKIVLSRSHPKMLRRLLELEVPEIFNGTVEIKAIAREAGSRSKVAVAARQPGVDPVGACVGMRGVRIKSIVNELGGEKIDVIEWSPDTETFIAKALSPAKVLSVQLDEDPDGRKSASVVVPEDQLSLAIGRAGQNARLAAKLSDHRIDIQGVTEAATWALQRVNEDPEVLPNLGSAAELLPSVANILQRHEEEEDMPYSSEELLKMRRVIEAVWNHYASLRRAERERRKAEEEARLEALEQVRAVIPGKAYETPVEAMDLGTRAVGRLEDAGLVTAGEVMERLIADGDKGLLDLDGIGPKTVEHVKEGISELGLLEGEPVAAEEEVVEEEAEDHVEALDQVRAIIPGKAYDTPVEAMDLGTRAVGFLEDAGLVTAGEVMERLITDGDEGLLELEGIGPKTVEQVKEGISELGLLEGEPLAAEEEATVEGEAVEEIVAEAAPETESEDGVPIAEESAVDVGEEEVEDKAAMLERAMRSQGAEDEEEQVEVEEEDVEAEEEREYFFDEEEPIDREEKLKRERGRRVQLIFDEETGELIPRRRRKREEGPEDWSEYLDF
jgi:N utilization substance protein A